ncbi:MAG: hypothetical protein PHF29_00535 [Candidatus Riflebacteria bacterium]|nr:hypothetical protein [Candidatus Riflebacteria bacterium]
MKNLGMGLSGSKSIDMFVLHFGSLLLNKKSINSALRALDDDKTPRYISSRAVKMVEYLESGNVADYNVFKKAFPFLPDRVIHIISLPISDRTKGILLVNWKYIKFSVKTLFSYIYAPILSVSFGCFIFRSCALFAFPQLKEIMYGLNVEQSHYAEFLLGSVLAEGSAGIVIMIPVVLFCLLMLFAIIILFVKGANKLQDRANLLRMLAVLPFNERLSVLAMMSEKQVYRSEYSIYKDFTNLLNEGVDINSAAARAGLNSQLVWLMHPALRNETSSDVIFDVAVIFEKRLEYLIAKTGHTLRFLAILFEAVLFTSCVWIMCSSLSAILAGAVL